MTLSHLHPVLIVNSRRVQNATLPLLRQVGLNHIYLLPHLKEINTRPDLLIVSHQLTFANAKKLERPTLLPFLNGVPALLLDDAPYPVETEGRPNTVVVPCPLTVQNLHTALTGLTLPSPT